MPENPKPRFTREEIASRVRELAEAIRNDAGEDREIVLVGILKGASVFLSDLLRAMRGPVTYGFVDVIRDMADAETANALAIDFHAHLNIRDRNVYLLKDVVSTGIIENYLLTQLRSHEPAKLKLVALLDRPDLRTIDVQADFRAFMVGEGTFVGYGLEQQERWAQLPFIVAL